MWKVILLILELSSKIFCTSVATFESRVVEPEEIMMADKSLSSVPKVEQMIKIMFTEFELPKNYNRLQTPDYNFGILSMKSSMKKIINTDSPRFKLQKLVKMFAQKVNATLRIINISEIDELNEEIIFNADLIVQWVDQIISRATYEKYNITNDTFKGNDSHIFEKTLDPMLLMQIWKPDIIIDYLVKVQAAEMMTKPVTVRLNEITGEVIYISRVRIHMDCEMDFHYYPADSQDCKVILRSNSYSNEELKLNWADPGQPFLEDCSGSNFDFQLNTVKKFEKVERYFGKTRVFSALGLTITARRKLSYHVVQTFLPSVLLIVITWLCFLIPFAMVEARIGIAMTILLTLTAMFASVRENSPPVSYVRAIDIWMVFCIFFVFLTLLEFTALLWWRKKIKIEEEEQEKRGGFGKELMKSIDEINDVENVDIELTPLKSKHKENQKKMNKSTGHAEFVETYAFSIFAFVFFIFNLCYWGWLLIGSDYFDWDIDSKYNNCQSRWLGMGFVEDDDDEY